MSATGELDGTGATLPINRVEALTDGIFAVAMTLLVIELKLPEGVSLNDSHRLAEALVELLPKASAWVLSFFVLSLFWLANHRVLGYVRRADSRLAVLTLVQLAFVSLMPFSSAVIGQHGVLLAQVVYSANMALLSLSALLVARYIHRHPELTHGALSQAHYLGACWRIWGLVLISVVAVALAAVIPWSGSGNMAFMLMAGIVPLSRSIEQRYLKRETAAATR